MLRFGSMPHQPLKTVWVLIAQITIPVLSLKARREAQEADVVVVNHHLFFADLSIKRRRFWRVAPQRQCGNLSMRHTNCLR